MTTPEPGTAVVHVPPPASTPEGQLLTALVVARRAVGGTPLAADAARHHHVLARAREVLLAEGLVLELADLRAEGEGGGATRWWRARVRLAHVGGAERLYFFDLVVAASRDAAALSAEVDRLAHLRVLGLAVEPAPEAVQRHMPVQPPKEPARRDQRRELAESRRRQLTDLISGVVLRAATEKALVTGVVEMLAVTGGEDIAEHAWMQARQHCERLELNWGRVITLAQRARAAQRRARQFDDQAPPNAGSKID